MIDRIPPSLAQITTQNFDSNNMHIESDNKENAQKIFKDLKYFIDQNGGKMSEASDLEFNDFQKNLSLKLTSGFFNKNKNIPLPSVFKVFVMEGSNAEIRGDFVFGGNKKYIIPELETYTDKFNYGRERKFLPEDAIVFYSSDNGEIFYFFRVKDYVINDCDPLVYICNLDEGISWFNLNNDSGDCITLTQFLKDIIDEFKRSKSLAKQYPPEFDS